MSSSEKRRERAREKKRQLARTKQARIDSKNKPAPPLPSNITIRLRPHHLALAGPLVLGSWSVPAPMRRYLEGKGLPVPKPVVGYMLVDTGASRTSIALEVAEQDLGLTATSVGKGYGASGLHDSKIFLAGFQLPIDSEGGARVVIENEMMAAGIPRMNEAVAPLDMRDSAGRPCRMIGLLGRDFLGHVTMTYRGVQGIVEFVVHRESMVHSPGRVEGPFGV